MVKNLFLYDFRQKGKTIKCISAVARQYYVKKEGLKIGIFAGKDEEARLIIKRIKEEMKAINLDAEECEFFIIRKFTEIDTFKLDILVIDEIENAFSKRYCDMKIYANGIIDENEYFVSDEK